MKNFRLTHKFTNPEYIFLENLEIKTCTQRLYLVVIVVKCFSMYVYFFLTVTFYELTTLVATGCSSDTVNIALTEFL